MLFEDAFQRADFRCLLPARRRAVFAICCFRYAAALLPPVFTAIRYFLIFSRRFRRCRHILRRFFAFRFIFRRASTLFLKLLSYVLFRHVY